MNYSKNQMTDRVSCIDQLKPIAPDTYQTILGDGNRLTVVVGQSFATAVVDHNGMSLKFKRYSGSPQTTFNALNNIIRNHDHPDHAPMSLK